MLKRLRSFTGGAIALFLIWIGLMSGVLSLVRELYGLYSGKVPPKDLFWSCALIACVIALVLGWLREHFKYLDVQQKYIETQETPDIMMRIEHISFSKALVEDKAFIIIIASLRNKGIPTSIDEWILMVEPINASNVLQARMLGVPDELVIPSKQTPELSRVLLGTDALYTKAISPIVKGQLIRGHLWFEVDERLEHLGLGTKLTLSCADITGKRLSCDFTLENIQGPTLGDIGFPGSDLRVIQRTETKPPTTARPSKKKRRR